ncbi:unnamed protein product [Hymenolepis diminuta]|uniref:G_PROTEIN_RECEP_F1_2 domain-containing protein n=1 Tax=Hymenolepis diminuta TaxID=6216 RepID=A0A0R3S887_HYMDI|nr:unnamed protein product [Hymenolepis diminuta]
MENTENSPHFTCSPPPPTSLIDCVIKVVIFAFMSVFIIFGNGLVVWIVLTTKRMRTVTNYFLVNLSLGDMLSVFQIIPNVYVNIANDWPFGLAYCRFSQFFTAFSIALSVLTFTGLTADRPRSRPSTILCIIGCIWIVSFLIGLPALIASHIEVHVPCSSNESSATISPEHINTTDEQNVQLSCILYWTDESGLAFMHYQGKTLLLICLTGSFY